MLTDAYKELWKAVTIDEMGGACGMYGGGERCAQGSVGEA